MRWLADDKFTFLGYREYDLVQGGSDDSAGRTMDSLVARPGSGLGHPALGPAPVGLVRRAAGRGAQQDPRAADARPHQGELALDRAPAGLPGLRRGQDVRRGRHRDRRAPLPRAVHLLVVQRQRAAHPGAAAQGSRGPGRVRLRGGQPQRQGPAADPRDVPARRAVPDLGARAARDRAVGDAPAGAPADPAVPAQGRLRPVHVLPGLPAAGPLHDRRPAGHGADPARGAARGDRRLHRAGVGVGAGPAALRRPGAQGRGRPRRRPGRARGQAGRGDPVLGGRLRGGPGRPVRRGGRGRPAARLRRRVPRGVQGGLPGPDGGGRPQAAGGAVAGDDGAEPLRAARRRAGRAAVQDLLLGLAAVAVAGAAGAATDGRRGRRRAAVRGRAARARAGLGLRLRPALRGDLGRRGREGPLPGGVRRDLGGRGRVGRLQRARAAGRADLAAGHGAARVREVPAAGRARPSARSTSSSRSLPTSR